MDIKNSYKKIFLVVCGFAFLLAGYYYRQSYKLSLMAVAEEPQKITLNPAFDNKTDEEKRKWLLTHFENDEVLGETKAPLVVIDYSSFSCSYCRKMRNEAIAMLYNDYVKTGKIKYIHRPTVNNRTIFLAAMLKCAKGEENFKMASDFFTVDWLEVDDMEAEIVKIAKNYGYTEEMVSSCIRNKESIESIIKAQLLSQSLLGTKVVPTIFIGDESISGYKKSTTLKKIIDERLQSLM